MTSTAGAPPAGKRVVAILQARMGSTRLPGKVLEPILGRPLIARMIERVRRSRRIDELWLATSDQPRDDPLAAEVEALGVPVFRGSEEDVLSRYAAVARKTGAEVVVRLTGDCPLADPQLIDEVIEHFLRSGADYLSNSLQPTYPHGLDVEVFTRAALDIAEREAKLPFQREHVTPYIHRFHDGPGPFRVEHHQGPADHSGLRWTVDEPVDLELVRRIYAALYPGNPQFSWLDAVALAAREPALAAMNAGIARDAGYRKALIEQLGKKAG